MAQSTNQGAQHANQSNQNVQQPNNQAQQPGNQVAQQPGNQMIQPMGNQTIPQMNQNGHDASGQTYGQTPQSQQMYPQQSQIPQQLQGIAQQAMGLEDFNSMDPHGTIKMNLVQPQNPMIIPGFGNNANRYGANMNQNIPMNGINANILNNLMELTGKPVQVPVDIVTVKSWSEAVNSVQTEDMVRDLNEIKNMNLVDDEDYLFNMYVHSPGLSDQLTLVSFLGGLYEAKYPHLFEKYNSLIMWLYYVLYQSICKGLKNVVEDNSTHKEEISKNTFSKFITRKSLKRKMASHAKEMSGSSAPKIYKTTNNEQSSILEGKKHIFYTTSTYTGNTDVFTIGKFANQLLPSDFAILSSACTFRKSNIAMGNNAAEVVNCGHIAFAQPILVQMYARSVRAFLFVGASNVEKLIEAVKAMVNLECINGLTIGTLKEQTMSNLDVSRDKTKFDMNMMKEPDRIMCCVLSYVRCSMNNQRSVEIKGYSSNFYSLNQQYLKSPESEARLAKIVEENEEKMVQKLDAYNKAHGFHVDDSDDDDNGATKSTEM